MESFRAELKQHLPGAYDLLKKLYSTGMIKGLRGVVLELGEIDEPQQEVAAQKEETKLTCRTCRHWWRDKVGDGTGIGICKQNVRPDHPKWPGKTACNQYQVAIWPL